MPESYRTTFDKAATLYHVRPSYPPAIIESILSYSQIPANGTILEIGVGTGQITLPFAQRGYEVLGLELGNNLTIQARENLKDFPKVTIEQANFESWNSNQHFDLILSAQAFHWIDNHRGLEQTIRFLKTSGTLALVWTFDETQTDFQQAANPVYDQFIPDTPDRPTPLKGYQGYRQALESHPLFQTLSEHSVNWERTYRKDDYLRLHDTYSNHQVLSQDIREAFKLELSKIIDIYGGAVSRIYRTVLLCAKRI